MTAKIPENTLDMAEKMYASGKSLREISIYVGRSVNALSRGLKLRGVEIKKTTSGRIAHNTISSLPEHQICKDYQKGESENSIAKTYAVSRNVIRRILINSDVAIRNQSESERMKWSKMSNEQRANQVKLAHDACRGRVRSEKELEKMAISRSENFADWFVGVGEPELKSWFESNNIDFEYQKPCLSYNLDFVVKGVDLELTSSIGRNKASNDIIFNRAERIYSQGYKTLYVEFRGVDRLVSNAEFIIKLIDRINKGEYGEAHYILLRICEDRRDITIMN